MGGLTDMLDYVKTGMHPVGTVGTMSKVHYWKKNEDLFTTRFKTCGKAELSHLSIVMGNIKKLMLGLQKPAELQTAQKPKIDLPLAEET